MHGFLKLCWKEWRDARAVALAFLVLAPVAFAATEELAAHYRHQEVVGGFVLPALVGLFAAVLAADLVAHDATTGTLRSMATLPVEPERVWRAKVTFLGTAVAAYAVWCLACLLMIYAARASESGLARLVDQLPVAGLFVALAAPLAAAVLLFSTMLQRGFVSVIVGALLCGASIATLLALAAEFDLVAVREHPLIGTAVLTAVFLSGSLVAYAHAHAATLLRRAVLGLAIPLGLLVPISAVGAAVVYEQYQVSPGDPDAFVGMSAVSPDGKYLLLYAHPRKKRRSVRAVTWVLDVESGDVVELPFKGLYLHWLDPWTDDGAVRMWTTRRNVTEQNETYDRLWEFELRTGDVRRSESHDDWMKSDPRARLQHGWASITRTTDETVITWPRAQKELRVPRRAGLHAAKLPGFAYEIRAGETVVVHDVTGGTSDAVDVVPATAAAWRSPEGGRILVWDTEHRSHVIDLTTGKVLFRELEDPDEFSAFWPHNGISDRYLVLTAHSPPRSLVLDLQTGRRVELGGTFWFGGVQVGPNGQIFAKDQNETIGLLDTDGNVLRTLYAPRGEED